VGAGVTGEELGGGGRGLPVVGIKGRDKDRVKGKVKARRRVNLRVRLRIIMRYEEPVD
jgi:hypothetical protein